VALVQILVIKNMYEECKIGVRAPRGAAKEFYIGVGLH